MPMNDFVRLGSAFNRAPIDGGSVRRRGRLGAVIDLVRHFRDTGEFNIEPDLSLRR
jgi:hypothetical protein